MCVCGCVCVWVCVFYGYESRIRFERLLEKGAKHVISGLIGTFGAWWGCMGGVKSAVFRVLWQLRSYQPLVTTNLYFPSLLL